MPISSKKPLRLASINIEGDKRLEAVVSFLKKFRPDVSCFQELTEPQVAFFEKALGMKGYFLPMTRFFAMADDRASPVVPFGIGLYSTLPMKEVKYKYYYGGKGNLPTLDFESKEKISVKEETVWRGVIQGTMEKDSHSFTVATTHFTRTHDGSPSEKQRRDLKKLLGLLDDNPELILCGDFNAPRGGEIFTNLSNRFKDNIPAKYDSSLDPKLHRVGHLKRMVDGLFSAPEYIVSDVKLTGGVSDHMAVTALILKTE